MVTSWRGSTGLFDGVLGGLDGGPGGAGVLDENGLKERSSCSAG